MLGQQLICDYQGAIAALGIKCVVKAEQSEVSSTSHVWSLYRKASLSRALGKRPVSLAGRSRDLLAASEEVIPRIWFFQPLQQRQPGRKDLGIRLY